MINIRGLGFYELWWWETNVENHEMWIEFLICVKWWMKKTHLRFKRHWRYGVEDCSKEYTLIQIGVLNVVVDLGGKWQRGLKGEKKCKLPRATKVV